MLEWKDYVLKIRQGNHIKRKLKELYENIREISGLLFCLEQRVGYLPKLTVTFLSCTGGSQFWQVFLELVNKFSE